MSEFSKNDLVSDIGSLSTNHCSSRPPPLLFTDKKTKAKRKKKTTKTKAVRDLAKKQMANHGQRCVWTLHLLVESLTFLPQNADYVQILCYTINVFS